MIFHLRDINQDMVDAWKAAFRGVTDVEISQGDIFHESVPSADAVVSPANSFAFMDGSIDLVYSQYFGWDLPERLQALLRKDHGGILPVGQAVIVKTNHDRFPYLVSAPTMTVPMRVDGTINTFLAFRAVIREVKKHNSATVNGAGGDEHESSIGSILCPGLGTAVGKMPFDVAAAQMRAAYDNAWLGRVLSFESLASAWNFHDCLRRGMI